MEKDMTKGRPLPVILKFMLPLIIGNIFQQLYNMADTIIVGRYVGADALAASRIHRNDHVSYCGLLAGNHSWFLRTHRSALRSQRYRRGKDQCSKRNSSFPDFYRAHQFFKFAGHAPSSEADEHT